MHPKGGQPPSSVLGYDLEGIRKPKSLMVERDEDRDKKYRGGFWYQLMMSKIKDYGCCYS